MSQQCSRFSFFFCLLWMGMGAYAQSPPEKIAYFLEVRLIKDRKLPIARAAGNEKAEEVYHFTAGEMIKFTVSVDEFMAHLNLERAGLNKWQAVGRLNPPGGEIFVRDDWRDFITVSPLEQPVELTFAAGANEVITIFRDPGIATWRVCIDHPELCIGWPSRSADLTLIDTAFVQSSKTGKPKLFYNVKFAYKTESTPTHPSEVRTGAGWVAGAYMLRKLGQLPALASLTAPHPTDDTPVVSRAQVQELIQKTESTTLAKMSLQDRNEAQALEGFSRWIKPASEDSRNPASMDRRTLAESLNFKIDFDFEARFGLMSFSRTLDGTQTKMTETAGQFVFSGIAPILFDLEGSGRLIYTKGIAVSSGNKQIADMISFDQHLLYTLRSSPKDAAIKAGFGWSAMGLTKGSEAYGLAAGLGIHALITYDSSRFFANLRSGAIFNTRGYQPFNNETILGGGWRLNSSRGYLGWSVTGEIDSISFKEKSAASSATMRSYLLGLRYTY